jgi:HAE1 family hydrophobic/amphiphilic exporter-1
LLFDFAVAALRPGMRAFAATPEACVARFGPIFMPTLGALVGTRPMALGRGAGAAARRPLGLAVVGGLLVSQLLTLYITPVYYVYIEGLRQRLTRRHPAPVEAPVHA